MSLSEQTVKCKICGRPYKTYAYFAGDQSACSRCVREAESNRSNDVRIPEGLNRVRFSK